MSILKEVELIKIKSEKDKDPYTKKFIIEPLLPGFGLTIAHAIRRILLSSLEGSAISSVKIEGITHEFSTIKGVKEDIIEIILNLKGLRLKLNQDEPTIIKLNKKGPGIVTAADFEKNPAVEIINPDYHIATLDKNGKLQLEAIVDKGRGYVPVEKRKDEKHPLGQISIDSIYNPVRKIHYQVENTRVGGMTNFDKIILEITTDGSITPEEAFKISNKILIEHFNLIDTKLSDLYNEKNKKSLKNETTSTVSNENKSVKKSNKKVKNEKIRKKKR